MKRSKWKEYASWYLLLLIPLAGTVIFNVYPLIQTFIDSFQNMKNVFIGGVNYKILWEDEIFRQSVVNTLYMAVLGVCFNVPIAFIIANMLNNIPIAKNVYKVVFLLPMIMSMITVGTLFKYLMMPGEEGIFNFLLEYIGLGPYDWLNDPAMAREFLDCDGRLERDGIQYHLILRRTTGSTQRIIRGGQDRWGIGIQAVDLYHDPKYEELLYLCNYYLDHRGAEAFYRCVRHQR